MSSSISGPAPSSSTSNRRFSISSVTSLGRQRKEHSLLDVVTSLGKRSQPSDDGVSVRSRQLDFGSADDGDVDDENKEYVGHRNTGAESQASGNARLGGRGRRRTVFWSADEEEFLRRGVIKYGLGKWKSILTDGQDVFSKHRTNVDLKDKWKNMQKTNLTNRKRTAKVNNLAPPIKQEEQPAVHHASRTTAKKHKTSDDASALSSGNSARSRTDRRAAVVANRALASAKIQEGEAGFLPGEEDEDCPGEETCGDCDLGSTGSYHVSEPIVLKFATDKSFPELIEVHVSIDACKDVSALKKLVCSSNLSDLLPNGEVQMIGLESRQLFDDDELLSQCIKKNGVDFFLVFKEAPEVFV